MARRYLLGDLEGRRHDAIRLAEDAIAAGKSVTDLYARVLGRAQVEIGRLQQRGEIHVAEEHLSSRITEQVLAIVDARMPRQARNGRRVLAATASGDLHDIGLRLVAVAAKLVLHVGATVEWIRAVRGATGVRHLPILVGGTPVQIAPGLCRTAGADGVASGAVEAVAVGEQLKARRA